MKVCALLNSDEPSLFTTEGPHARSPFVLTCDHAGRGSRTSWRISAFPRRALDARGLRPRRGRARTAALRPPRRVPDHAQLLATRDRREPSAGRTRFDPHALRAHPNRGQRRALVRRRSQTVRGGVPALPPAHSRRAGCAPRTRSPSVLVALHSFTPVYMDERAALARRRAVRPRCATRPAGAGGLRRDRALVVGDNQPYSVSDATDYTIVVHGEQRGIPHVELEIRQDLLASEADVRALGRAPWTRSGGGGDRTCSRT